MSPPDETPPPRIIIPGSEEEPSAPRRLIVPGADDDSIDSSDDEESPREEAPRAGRSRIVLPPGVTPPETEAPEYPRLRPLVLIPVADGGREFVLVQDPLGIIRGQPVLGIDALPLLQLLDGTVSLNDLTAALMRESKDLRVAGAVRDFVAKLDELLMLDSPRFQQAWQEARDAYHGLEIRQAALDGRSYPADPADLTRFLKEHEAQVEDDAAPARSRPPRAILAPHLDPRRAGAAMARAYRELDGGGGEPLRIVVFGTGHSLFGDLLALTRKHFETPLGRLECDVAFVDAVAERIGDGAYRSELAHRDEHSIEFQAIYIAHRLTGRRVRIVPILCGGFHALLDDGHTPREQPEFEALIEAVRDAERRLGGTTVYVAGVDFSHVGPRFGDPAVDDRTRSEAEAIDRAALDAAQRGDADGWFRTIADHDDATRICGFAPTYAMLRCAEPGSGRLLHYERSDEPDSSFVSIASMVWD